MQVDVFVADKYFDVSDFSGNPLKTYVQYEYRPLTSLYKVASLYKLKRNEVRIQNSPFGIGAYGKWVYHSVVKSDNYFRTYN